MTARKFLWRFVRRLNKYLIVITERKWLGMADGKKIKFC